MRRAVFHLVLWPVLATLAGGADAATSRHRRSAPAPTRAELRREEREAERADPCARLSPSRRRSCEIEADRAARAEEGRESRVHRRSAAPATARKTTREIQPEDLVGGVEPSAPGASPPLRGSLGADGPAPVASARANAGSRRTPARAGKLREVILEDGQTLDALATATGVSVADLARLNGIASVEDVPTGMRLKLPAGATQPAGPHIETASPPSAAPIETSALAPGRRSRRELASSGSSFGSSPGPSSGPRPYASLGSEAAPVAPPPVRRGGRTEADALAAYAVASARAPHVADREEARHDRFVWPVRAEVTSAFGAHGMGQRNDGVDLAARPGDAVRASAAGEVVYAGKEIASSGGNLVLLKHVDGWVTAYSHLGRLTVAMRQTVEQGQEIAETVDVVGASVHFEVRQPGAGGAKPVDPVSVLPARGASSETGRG